jgi:hypothetical protein
LRSVGLFFVVPGFPLFRRRLELAHQLTESVSWNAPTELALVAEQRRVDRADLLPKH